MSSPQIYPFAVCYTDSGDAFKVFDALFETVYPIVDVLGYVDNNLVKAMTFYPKSVREICWVYHLKMCLREGVAWQLPDTNSFKKILGVIERIKFQGGGAPKILELNAGRGFISRLLQIALKLPESSYIATDNMKEIQDQQQLFYPVKEMDVLSAVDEYKCTELYVTCWPRGFIHDAVVKIFETPCTFDRHLLIIGELENGCCAGNKTFAYLDQNAKLVEEEPLLNWHDVNGGLRLYCFPPQL